MNVKVYLFFSLQNIFKIILFIYEMKLVLSKQMRMEKKPRKPGSGRKPLPKGEKKIQFQVTVKQKNKAKIKKAIMPIVKEMDV